MSVQCWVYLYILNKCRDRAKVDKISFYLDNLFLDVCRSMGDKWITQLINKLINLINILFYLFITIKWYTDVHLRGNLILEQSN